MPYLSKTCKAHLSLSKFFKNNYKQNGKVENIFSTTKKKVLNINFILLT